VLATFSGTFILRRVPRPGFTKNFAGDTILLAGKGHETYQVIGTVKEPFDERAVVRDLGAE
jgi:UDP-N-acetylmuramoyl-L-alanyl-D-glutamate--2,6-diaminopimelate ligase